MLSWIDSHTHLEYEYPFSLEEYFKNANAQGVKGFITIGTEEKSFETLQKLAAQNPKVYFTLGIHPHDSKDFNTGTLQKMAELCQDEKCIAIGEIGLDYYYSHSARETQKEVLAQQLEFALQEKLPIVIHSRDAEEELLVFLKDYSQKCTLPNGPGIIHCFSGTEGFAKACLDLGFFLSFSGIVTFKNAHSLRDIVASTPLDRVLLETDAPFLSPVPYRGKPNQSAYLIETAKVVAQCLKIDLELLSKKTFENTLKVFSIEDF